MTPSCSVVSTASFQSGSVHCTRACFRPAWHHQTLRLSLFLLAFLHLFCSSSFVVAFPFPFAWFPGVSLPAAPLFPGTRFRFSARRVALKIELPKQAEYGFSERGPRSIYIYMYIYLSLFDSKHSGEKSPFQLSCYIVILEVRCIISSLTTCTDPFEQVLGKLHQ